MKVVIRDADKNLFLGRNKQWVAEKERAIEFENLMEAYTKCPREELANCDIILSHGDTRFDISSPARTR